MDVKQIKRLLALIKAEVEYDRDNELDLPEGFKESFESQKEFRGWINYKETWYIDENNDPWKVVLIHRPLVEDWHDELRKVVPVITPEGDIVGADEWEKRSHSTK
jgi:hypothetical protein